MSNKQQEETSLGQYIHSQLFLIYNKGKTVCLFVYIPSKANSSGFTLTLYKNICVLISNATSTVLLRCVLSHKYLI